MQCIFSVQKHQFHSSRTRTIIRSVDASSTPPTEGIHSKETIMRHDHAAATITRAGEVHPAAGVHDDGLFVLHFQSLFHTGRDFAFACDAQGHVDLDGMNERIRNNYLYARAMIGREVSWPSVRRTPDAWRCAA
jgi:hypothetical protein